MATLSADERPLFLDRSGSTAKARALWPALVVPREQIDAEIERLAALPRPTDGRRAAWIVHPLADPASPGLAPGIRVSLEVLRPGESTAPVRHSSTRLAFCIAGGGEAIVRGRSIRFERYDLWNVPAMATYVHRNDRDELQVLLGYSNAPLLEKLNVHLIEEGAAAEVAHGAEIEAVRRAADPSQDARGASQGAAGASRRADAIDGGSAASASAPSEAGGGLPPGVFPLDRSGACLMPYERLIDPPVVESRPLHFPWRSVKQHLDEL